MNQIRHFKGKVLALAPAISISGITLLPAWARAEVTPAVSSGSPEVVRTDVPDVAESSPLEARSMKASDLVVESPNSLPVDLSDGVPVIGITAGVPVEFPLSQSPPANPAPPTTPPNLWERSRLTGNWGGFRSKLEAAGIILNVEFTPFYQGLATGSGRQIFFQEGAGFQVEDDNGGYGGRLDAFIKLDTGKLGLWPGGGVQTHLEYRFGALAGGLGNTFFPTNAAMEFPGDSPDILVATSLYLTQQFGDSVSLLIGKINALDLLANDLFFGGWGIHRFFNAVFAAPPSGLVPPVFYGAIANVKIDPVTVSFWIYDPVDRTREYWPENLFAEGVTFSLTTSYATKIAGRPTTFSLTGIYTTKTGTDFSSISEAWRSRLQPSTKTGSYSIQFQFSHLLHQNPSSPKQGWGLFFKGAISDGNPNYVQNSLIAGIGGTGLFRGRELDSFGVGYYYYNLSDALQDSLNDIFRRVSLGDEQGIEVYYSFAITPWFFLTADFQYIRPPRSSFEDAFMVGVRANIRF